MAFDFSRADVDRILAAIDSHVYWQLSEQHYRNDASVLTPGSDDPEQAREIAACRALEERLAATR